MLRAIKPCKLLSGWTNVLRTNQIRVASTAFGVQPALNNSAYSTTEKIMAVDKGGDRINDLRREVMKNNHISEKNFQMSLNSIKANSPNQEIISLIQCFGLVAVKTPPEERINYVNKVWDKLKNSGINLDVSHYNTLLSVYIENEHKFLPTEILEEMKKTNVKPNRVTYRYLLSVFCREGDLSGASSILEMMKDESILYNEYIFHELIMGHCIAKDINGAENVIKIMKEKNFDIGSSTHAAYLCGLAICRDLAKFDSVLQKCEEDGINFQREHIISIAYNLVLNGQTARACEIIQSYNPILKDSLHVLLLRILNKKKYNECLHILSVLGENAFHSNIGNIVCNYVADKVPFETIKNIANDLEKKGQSSDFLLKTLYFTLKKKEFNKSLNIIKHLHDNGHLAKEVYFWPIVANAVQEKSVDNVLNILRIMRQEFGLKFSRNLLVRVIFNYFSDPLLEQRLLSGLLSLGSARSYIQENFALSCLLRNRLNKIYELSEYINPSKSINLVVTAIVESREARSPAKVVGLIYNLASSAGRRSSADEVPGELTFGDGPENISSSPQDVVDNIVKGLVSKFRISDHDFLKEILEEMVRCKLPVSKEVGEFIKTRVTKPNVGDIVDELIKLPPLDVSDNSNNQNKEESKSNSEIITRFLNFCKKNMIEEAEKILEEHPDVLNNLSVTFMMALKRTNNEEKLNECLMKHVTKIRETGKGTENSVFLVSELFRKGFIKEACVLLGNLGKNQYNRRFAMETLSPLLDKASINDIATLLNTINEKENIISLHSIVHYYHDMRNFMKIIEILEAFNVKNIEELRLVGNLIKPLVEEGETELVKKVVGILEEKFPLSKVFNELIFSYAYIGDVKKAREYLDKFTSKGYFFVAVAANINNDKIRVTVLENMLSIIMGSRKISKKPLYERLIEDYATMNMDPQKGLALWEQMQDDNLVASPIFLTYLARLLKANNMPVPFDKSAIDNQEWLLNCNIPRPILNQLLEKYHVGDMNGVDEVIRQGIKSNLILPEKIKQMLHHLEGKEEEKQMKNTLTHCLSLAEFKQTFDQGRLLQHATRLSHSRDPKIILDSIPHAFLVDCLMTETFDRLPSEIAKIIMWAHSHEILQNERLAQMYEAEVKGFIKERTIVEGLLKFGQYLTVKSQILNFLLSRGVFQRFGLEKEAAFLSRYKTNDRRKKFQQRGREQSLEQRTESEEMSNTTESTDDGQVFDAAVSSEETSYTKSNEEEVVAKEKSQAQAIPANSGST